MQQRSLSLEVTEEPPRVLFKGKRTSKKETQRPGEGMRQEDDTLENCVADWHEG